MNKHDVLYPFHFIKNLLRLSFENNEHISKSVMSNHFGFSKINVKFFKFSL